MKGKYAPIARRKSGDFTISQFFGGNYKVYARFGLKGHNGIDFVSKNAGEKIPTYACFDGTVIDSKRGNTGYGNFIKLKSADGKYEAVYAHLDNNKWKRGETVKAKELIGNIGTTGFSTGVHLHWGIREFDASGRIKNLGNGYKGSINPIKIIKYWGSGSTNSPATTTSGIKRAPWMTKTTIPWLKNNGIASKPENLSNDIIIAMELLRKYDQKVVQNKSGTIITQMPEGTYKITPVQL
jgi:murein DD-endopeptidase MepM/ murein hydrolase activator NlpD